MNETQHSLQEQIILYLCDELRDAERVIVEQRLANDPKAQQLLEELKRLQKAAQVTKLDHSSEGRLNDLNQKLLARIAQPSSASKDRILTLKRSFHLGSWRIILFRVGWTALFFVAGVWVGGLDKTTSDLNETYDQGIIAYDYQVDVAPAPEVFLETVRFDASSGSFEIQYAFPKDKQVRGTLESEEVQQQVMQALQDENQATLRLHTIKSIGEYLRHGHPLYPEIQTLLLNRMTTEQQWALRLRLLRILALVATEPDVQKGLQSLYLSSADDVFRQEAFDALVKASSSVPLPQHVLEIARADTNIYIRRKAEVLAYRGIL